MNYRSIKRYFHGKDGQDGAGVKLIRCFGYNDVEDFDPFLMMDFFDSTDPEDYIKGFPWHPHRGIETITYLIEGCIKHEDSLSNKGEIRAGDCQWMNAGSGILHQEMPQVSDRMLGTQIWLNLPKKDKMSSPYYQDIKKEQIPVYENDGLIVRIIAGEYEGLEGPIKKELTEPLFFDISLDENSEFILDLQDNFYSYSFVVEGEVNYNQNEENIVGKRTGVLFEDKGKIRINTKDKKARIFLLAGKPLKEEIAWGGPIVMNTKEELDEAFRQLQNGTFIK